MSDLHPTFIKKKGKREFAVLSYEEYLILKEAYEDQQDLRELEEAEANERNIKGLSLEEVKTHLGLK